MIIVSPSILSADFADLKKELLVVKNAGAPWAHIKIPANSYKFEVKPNGDVYSYDHAGSLPEKIGTIPIVRFDAPEALEQGNGNKMVATLDSGDPFIVKDNQNIRQHALESSNTNVHDQVNELMRLNTSIIACMNLAKVADSMYNKAINLREG